MLTRRMMLALSAAGVIPSLQACGTRIFFDLPELDVPIIDIHAHFFNGHDVPVVGFLEQVVLRSPHSEPEDSGLLTASLKLLKGVLLLSTPTASQELADLRGPPTPRPAAFRPDFQDQQRVALAIQRFREDIVNRQIAPAIGGRQSDDIRVLMRLFQETGVDPAVAAFSGSERTGAQIAAAIYERDERTGEYVRQTKFVQTLRWAGLLTRSRAEILDEYSRLYAGPGRVAVVSPSILDFELWFPEDEQVTPIDDQIDVMAELARQSRDVLVLNFVPFCPLRAAVERRANPRIDPLRFVKKAIWERGFAGVKLYPPLGFAPMGNARENREFGARPGSMATGAELDAELAALFAWCTDPDNDVPVKAHASNSNAAGECSAQLASPARWRDALDRFPNLRVNLAHFGGYHESNPDDFGPCTDVGPDWEQLIAEVAGDFANAYADIGYWTESYAEGLADGIRVRRNTRRLLREHPVLDERLMFGTDWSMLGREPTHPEYIAAINNSLELVGLDTDRLFYRNAIAYLGLTEGSPQWQRLERFFGAGRLSALSSG